MTPDDVPTEITRRAHALPGISQNAYAAVVADWESLRTGNALLTLSPAAIDVLDDMADTWADKDRHGELVSEQGYGPKKIAAFDELHRLITDAWKLRVNFADIEESK
ncbi:hypothetical protein [Streptomyces sp. NPDC008125]|uniref:hypothetical protein n=1 Tax=Streptomyces sp. NPDC008125 TaxID=3364811 RepID=UPI0036E33FD7